MSDTKAYKTDVDDLLDLISITVSPLHAQIVARHRSSVCDEAEPCEICFGTGLNARGKDCADCQGTGLISTW